MKLKHYELICLFVTLFLGYEYAIFNGFIHAESLIRKSFFMMPSEYKLNQNPAPGYPLSYFLGWLGFGIMLIMNLYSLRKRFNVFSRLGKLTGWLEFHIFCGILGPIFIIFHANFKIEGLVAISFWSMIIASTSGILGRYFYIQTLKKKEELKKNIDSMKNEFISRNQDKFTTEKFDEIFQHSYVLHVLISSLTSDIFLFFANPGKAYGLSKKEGEFLKRIGVENRRVSILAPFNLLLGYWHSFHLPFAFFMYLVAVIHIVTALLFGVKH